MLVFVYFVVMDVVIVGLMYADALWLAFFQQTEAKLMSQCLAINNKITDLKESFCKYLDCCLVCMKAEQVKVSFPFLFKFLKASGGKGTNPMSYFQSLK